MLTDFQPEVEKNGGTYVTVINTAKKIDGYEQVVVMIHGTVIPIDEIINQHRWADIRNYCASFV